MAPKTKTPSRKRARLSTSFKKGKVTPVNSGKKFKRMKKHLKRTVSDSPFSASLNLTPGKMSTPMERPKKKRKLNKNKSKVKVVKTNNRTVNEIQQTDIVFPSPVATTESKKAPILPPNIFLNESLSVKFRNDHMKVPDNLTDCSNDIIVIEDDEDEPKDKSAVEQVGEDLLKLVSNQPIPSTPRTIVRQLAECNKDNTIVLDTTNDDDDIEVIEDIPAAPLNTQNIQNVALRYCNQQQPTPDFIPLNLGGGAGSNRWGGGGESYSQVARKKPLRGKKVPRGGPTPGARVGPTPGSYRFTAGQAPNMNFGGAQSGSGGPRLFRFQGNRRPAPNPPVAATTGPTMLVAEKEKTELRPIVVDGSNVAMSHGKHQEFSSQGIELVVNYFKSRGHKKIVVFVPQFRSKPTRSTDKDLLDRMEKEGYVVFTPSREVEGRRIASHDDRYILDYAVAHGGVIVTRDNFREFVNEKDGYRDVITNRLLQPTFVGDDLMFPSDPLGRNGPNLDQFLKF